MEAAAHSLKAPAASVTRASAPILPASAPRQAPKFERRAVEVDLTTIRRSRHTSPGAYLMGAVGLAVVSVGGWFALAAYIYG